MLNSKGFDLWADGYDRAVGLSDEENTYPFAGYKNVLGAIYAAVLGRGCRRVLDIGFGTGVLTARLYAAGSTVTGIDFSRRMIEIAREKMPEAVLFEHDFSTGLPAELRNAEFDAVVCTYAIHHLTDEQKVDFIRELQAHLSPDGAIYIGDIAFTDREALSACRLACGDEWDEDEIYIAADELQKIFPTAQFEKFSHCAGVMTIEK